MTKMKMMKCLGPIVAVSAIAFAGAAAAEWPEKPIRFIVPYSPGGGFDTLARAFAPELEAALGAEVIVENVSGAGGRRGLQTMLNADADGHTISMFNVPGIVITQATGKLPEVDLNEVAWVASLSHTPYTLVLPASGGATSMEDLCALDRPAKFSATGPGSSSFAASKILMETVGCPYTVVTGYEGSTESVLAVIRGEVDAMVTGIDSASRFVDSGDAMLGMTFSTETIIEGVPTAADIGFPVLANFAQYRMVGASPETPDELVDALSAAFEQAANSEKLQAWSASSNRPIAFLNGEGAANVISEQFEVMIRFADAFE